MGSESMKRRVRNIGKANPVRLAIRRNLRTNLNLAIEKLEPRAMMAGVTYSTDQMRSLLAGNSVAGVTVITHGFQFFDNDGDSMLPLAQDIRMVADEKNKLPEDAWLLDYDLDPTTGVGRFDADKRVPGADTKHQDSILPTANAGRKGEVVLLYDWAPESNEASAGWAEAAGDALANLIIHLGLVNPVLPNSAVPIHFIAHSFGAAVTSEAVERFGALGIKVDQVTYLDPHDFNESSLPFDGAQQQYKLASPEGYGAAAWSNVGFTDVYYERADQTAVFGPRTKCSRLVYSTVWYLKAGRSLAPTTASWTMALNCPTLMASLVPIHWPTFLVTTVMFGTAFIVQLCGNS